MNTIAFVTGGGMRIGKAILMLTMIDDLRSAGHEVIVVAPEQLPRRPIERPRFYFDDFDVKETPSVERREPDWKQKKYFGNRKRRKH